MDNHIISYILEDIVAKGLKIDYVALRHGVKIQDIEILIKYYYGIDEYKLKSFNLDFNQSQLEIKKYNSNNLTIIDKNTIILEY